jgi:Xaa-Pro aminopeptidase
MARLPLVALLLVAALSPGSASQEARARWDRLNQIRRDKFDLVLPAVMREHEVDMWITMVREANTGSFWTDLGQGYVAKDGFYVFTDRGDARIERAALGIDGVLMESNGAYDLFLPSDELAAFVAERDPQRIAVNTSRDIGPADDLSHTGWLQLVETLGETYASRLVSAERLVTDFRSRRTASEVAAFAEAGEISRTLAERALSNEVITPGVTALEDVAWWLMDRLLERGLGSSFGLPSIYVTGPDGIAAVSTDRIIQRGDVLMIDWGVGHLGFFTDMKRMAYVLREGEAEAPDSLVHAFDRARDARDVIVGTIRPGRTAAEAEQQVHAALAEAGFVNIPFNQPTDDPDTTDVVIGCHSVGNTGHGIGPSVAFFNPVRREFPLRATNLLSIELFAYTAIPEWEGAKLRVPLEDDALVTERGVEWLYPVNQRLLLIR